MCLFQYNIFRQTVDADHYFALLTFKCQNCRFSYILFSHYLCLLNLQNFSIAPHFNADSKAVAPEQFLNIWKIIFNAENYVI